MFSVRTRRSRESAPRSARLGAGLLVLGCLAAPAPEAAQAQIRDYATVVQPGAQTDEGLFHVHRLEERLLFEIPDSILGRDMVVLSRFARAQTGLADGGDRMGPNIVVRWERRNDRVVLRAVSHANAAEEGSAVQLAVENSNFPPVIGSFPVEAEGTGTSVVDVTELYLGDHPTFSLPRNRRSELGVRGHDRDRSWIEWTRSFPINVEVRVVRSYAADDPPSNGRGGTVSYEVNHSMVLLPEEPMMPRLADERVTYITISATDYSRDWQGVRPQEYLRRYRLEPSDPEAFARGELVEPVEPIVWYIDPATPPEWVPYFQAGIEEWNEAFEEAGFRNALEARLAPTEEEDPDFSLLDARYSVVRYVATPVRSANATGELDDAREIVWREVRAGSATDTFRRNLQRAYLEQAHHLLHEAESDHWSPPASGNLRVSRNDDPPLNADLHIGQSDIRPLVRDQLRLLEGEIEEALERGVDDRMTCIHLEDALVRIGRALR